VAGDAGFALAPEDVVAATEIVRRLAASPELRVDRARLGVARAARFDRRAMARAYVESWRRALWLLAVRIAFTPDRGAKPVVQEAKSRHPVEPTTIGLITERPSAQNGFGWMTSNEAWAWGSSRPHPTSLRSIGNGVVI
jgi:hypothetical protein